MKYHLVLLCFAIILSLFFIKTAYSVNVAAENDDDEREIVFIIKQAFELKCNSSKGLPIKWEFGNAELNLTDQRFILKNPSPHIYTISTSKAKEGDAGKYSCVTNSKNQTEKTYLGKYLVAHQVHVKVPTNINVVEGEPLKLECQTIGNPTIDWTYQPEGAPQSDTTKMNTTDRVSFKAGDSEGSILEITGITEKDRGIYTCIGTPSTPPKEKIERSSCTVRVKGRYAALWPFLGICVEVFVLCLIIFIYEKKRNKTELEESDTDQSPDQKNTPDNGKDSNLRHRQ